jgi:hypothetical protein
MNTANMMRTLISESSKIVGIGWRLVLLCSLVPLLSACVVSLPPFGDETPTPTPTQPPAADLPPAEPDAGTITQWAQEAEASSSFSDDDEREWSPRQATGQPDTRRCGDLQTAWASAGPDSVEWLLLRYEEAVYVTGVNIHQTFNPNQVVKVELVDDFGDSLVIYDQPPVPVDQPCPYVLSIEIEQTEQNRRC